MCNWSICTGGDIGHDNGQCEQCAKGYYQNEEQAASCKPCSAGYYESGRFNIMQCVSSREIHCFDSIKTCLLCAAGSYENEEGSTRCNRCAQGSYQSQQGQASCTLCPAGKIGRSNFEVIYNWNTYNGVTSYDECKQAGDEYLLVRTYNQHGHHVGYRDAEFKSYGQYGSGYCHVSEYYYGVGVNIYYHGAHTHVTCQFGCVRYGDPLIDVSVCSFCPAGKEAGSAQMSSELDCNTCPDGKYVLGWSRL